MTNTGNASFWSVSLLSSSDIRAKSNYSPFESPHKAANPSALAVSPSLTCESCTESRIGSSSSVVTPEAQSPVHGSGSSYLPQAEEFLCLPERLGANEQQQQRQQQQQQQPQQLCCVGQQSVAAACFFDSRSSQAVATGPSQDREEAMHYQRLCWDATGTAQHQQQQQQQQQQLEGAAHAADCMGQPVSHWGGAAPCPPFVELVPQKSVSSPPVGMLSLGPFRGAAQVSTTGASGTADLVPRGKRLLEREKHEIRCIRRPVVLPLPVPKLQERPRTAVEHLEQGGGDPSVLLWDGDLGIESFVALSPNTPPISSGRGSGCWRLPIDMLRHWYRAAEGEGDDFDGSEALPPEASSSSTGGFVLPFSVTPEEIAAAAELATDTSYSPLSAGSPAATTQTPWTSVAPQAAAQQPHWTGGR